VYRGTPLWQEYVDRGIIDDERDWQKWFKCTDMDPTALGGLEVNRLRMKGYLLLFGKDETAAAKIKQLLTSDPPNARARFVDFSLSQTGLQMTRS